MTLAADTSFTPAANNLITFTTQLANQGLVTALAYQGKRLHIWYPAFTVRHPRPPTCNMHTSAQHTSPPPPVQVHLLAMLGIPVRTHERLYEHNNETINNLPSRPVMLPSMLSHPANQTAQQPTAKKSWSPHPLPLLLTAAVPGPPTQSTPPSQGAHACPNRQSFQGTRTLNPLSKLRDAACRVLVA